MNVSPAAPATTPSRAAALDLRVLRALPFAVVCVVVSALGHAFAGGGAVPVRTLLLGGLAVWALAAALAGRERSLTAIVAGLAAGQLALHLLFHCLAMASMPAGPGSSAMPGMDMSGMPGMTGMTGTPGTGIPVQAHPSLWTAAAAFGLTPLMLLGHSLAALTAGWWLRRGEAAVWRVLRVSTQLTETLARTWTAPLRTLLALAAALLRGLLGALGPDAATGLPPGVDGDERPLPRTAQLRHQVVRRGPPAPLTA